MFKNYFRIALRNFKKQKLYSSINILGLSAGIAICLLITLYVMDELSYDQYNKNYNNIYRVAQIHKEDAQKSVVISPAIVKPYFESTFPEVKSVVRIFDEGRFRPSIVKYKDKIFNESKFFFADSNLFNVFSFELLRGNPQAALKFPNSVVLTESTAKKYFGSENPVGKTLLINNKIEYTVTGLMKDIPRRSHIKFDFVASIYSKQFVLDQETNWNAANFYTYVLLKKGVSVSNLQNKINEKIKTDEIKRTDLVLQPLSKIHLYSHTTTELEANGNILYVWSFSIIAFLVLLIACINYINLATARAAKRAREVGIRKVLGAMKSTLIKQFYAESIISVFISVGLGLVLAVFSIPFFDQLSGKEIPAASFFNNEILFSLLGITIIVGLLTGSYPALLMSSFKPVKVLKGKYVATRSGNLTRKILVTSQFAISVLLVVSTFIIKEQLDYIQNKNLGFDKEQTLIIPITDGDVISRIGALKNHLETNPDVKIASAVKFVPGNYLAGYYVHKPGDAPDKNLIFRGNAVDNNFFKAANLKLAAGTFFPSENFNKDDYYYVLNETGVKDLDMTSQEAVGQSFQINPSRKGRIVGVVKDFNYASLHEKIEPLAFYYRPSSLNHLMIKTRKGNIKEINESIEASFSEFAPNVPFNYSYLDESIDQLYKSEISTGRIVTAFSIFALFIAALGLLGLVSYLTLQRAKEISIRKVLGASVQDIVSLFSIDFLKLVAVGLIIGSIGAYEIMNTWLENFAYKIQITPMIFILSSLVIILTALLSISGQSIKAALTDPVKNLRND